MEKMIIVGAGLVGSLLSVYLARAGYKVSVYERSPDPRSVNLQSGRSINITLCERGFQALDAVGVGDVVRKFCIPVYGRIMHAQDGELSYQPYGNHQEALYSIEREDLSRALLDFAQQQENTEFYFNEKCIDIDLPTATLKLQNSETGKFSEVQGERIFATDGAYSAVRQKMQRLKRFNFSQEYLDQGYKEIIIPPREDGSWVLAQNAIHIWPRDSFMLIGFPNLDKSFTLSLHLPYEGEISHQSTASADGFRNLFETYFSDVWPLVESCQIDSANKRVETMITIKCFPWTYQDKVLLIGDSSHAIFPSLGQGANAGFEDCQILAQYLEQYPGDWLKIFTEFESQRKPDADILAELCVEHFTLLRETVGSSDFLLRTEIERKVQELYPELTSLYYNISFTSMPFSEAYSQEQKHQDMINQLTAIDNLQDNLAMSVLRD